MFKHLLFFVFLSFSSLFSSVSFADQYLNELRWDELVPEDCHELSLSNFENIEEWPVYGIRGYTDRGFDYEYDISRRDASWLWNQFRNGNEPDSWPSHMDEAVEIVQTYKDDMGFDFKVEGEVLEILALVDLHNMYDPEEYFFTGGIEYRDGSGGRTMGELDVLVGERSTCNIVVVGEAKLGKGSLGKAHKQLNRFKGFLGSHLRPMSDQLFDRVAQAFSLTRTL